MATFYCDDGAWPIERAALRELAERVDADVFGIDLREPKPGLSRLLRARRAGRPTCVFPILPDGYESALHSIMQTIDANGDEEVRVNNYNALRAGGLLVNEKKPSELVVPVQAHIDALWLALRLADVTLIAAPGERARWRRLSGMPIERMQLLATPERTSDAFRADGLTIVAPDLPSQAIAPYVRLLHASGVEPFVVCAENQTDPIATRAVVTLTWRAMFVRDLAARGHHVAAPNPYGVEGTHPHIVGFEPENYRAMLAAVDSVMCATPCLIPTQPRLDDVVSTIDAYTQRVDRGPRVSIIVRTFDRPALLQRAIASISQQSFDDVEIIVVNNGGDDVMDLAVAAAAGRPLRYERMPERAHISVASNVGARSATGAYIGYLDDDDLLYADHCARTVDVLERTRADIVFTLCIAELAEVLDERKRVLGYQVYIDRPYSRDDIFVSNATPIHSIVHRRDAFERFGTFDETLPVTDDWELWLRMISRGARMLRIDRATCEYSWRIDPRRGNMTLEHQHDFVTAYDSIAQRHAAYLATRPSLRAQQAQTQAVQRDRAAQAADPARRGDLLKTVVSSRIVELDEIPVDHA